MEYIECCIHNIPEHFANYVHSYINSNIASNNSQSPIVTLIVVEVWVLKLDVVNQNRFLKLLLANCLENQLVHAFHSPKPVIQ